MKIEIIKYDLLHDTNVFTFDQRVKEKLNEGWKLHGVTFTIEKIICQAFVKTEETELSLSN